MPGFSSGSKTHLRAGVGDRGADLLGADLGVVEELDDARRRRPRLRHLRRGVLEVGDLGGRLEDVGLGQPEGLLVAVVEPLGEVAGELEVLALVLADGHVVRPVEQDVGCLEDRVGEQADTGRPLPRLGRLVLELGHPPGLADAGNALEHPGQLGMGRDLALHEDRRPGGVDAHGQELGGRAERALAQHGRVLLDGDGVLVGDEEERLVVTLEVHPLAQGAQVVAEVERVRGGLDPREHPRTGASDGVAGDRQLGLDDRAQEVRRCGRRHGRHCVSLRIRSSMQPDAVAGGRTVRRRIRERGRGGRRPAARGVRRVVRAPGRAAHRRDGRPHRGRGRGDGGLRPRRLPPADLQRGRQPGGLAAHRGGQRRPQPLAADAAPLTPAAPAGRSDGVRRPGGRSRWP